MARKEPSLVPEWLKGAAAAAATGRVSQFPRSSFLQGNSISSENDSSAHAFPERVLYPSSRRPGTSDGLIEHAAEQSPRPRSFISSRSRVYHSNGLDLDAQSNHDWNHDESLMHGERSKDTTLDISGSNEKGNDRYLSEAFAFHRQSSEKYLRYAPDTTIRRMRFQKSLGDGGEKTAMESAASPISTVGLTGSMQNAISEQKFPYLNAQDRLYALQSNLRNISLSNSSLVGEPPSRTDSKHVLSGDVRIAHFDRVPNNKVAVGSTGMIQPAKISDSTERTILSADMAAAISSQSMAPLIASSVIEALGSSSTHVPKPAKLRVETQQLEEQLAPRQLRLLVSMKPAFPRIMSPTPGDKLKLNTVEPAIPVTSWVTQTSSRPFNATHRQELPKSTSGKLVLRKSNRDAPATNTSFTKLEGGTYVPLVASSGSKVAMGKIGVSQTSTMNVSLPKQPKQVLVQRAVPISVSQTADDVGTIKQYMARKSTSYDKRISVQAQNRSEFFNALRRKAAVGEAASSTFENKTSALRNKDEVFDQDEFHDDGVVKKDGLLGCVHSGIDGSAVQKSSGSMSIPGFVNGNQKGKSPNGLILEGIKVTAESLSPGMLPASHVSGSEEEEAAFLRLLGWQESAEEGEEALTEEEINAFYQEHKASLSSPSFICQKRRLKSANRKSRVGSIGSISSGLSSSDSDSEEESSIRYH